MSSNSVECIFILQVPPPLFPVTMTVDMNVISKIRMHFITDSSQVKQLVDSSRMGLDVVSECGGIFGNTFQVLQLFCASYHFLNTIDIFICNNFLSVIRVAIGYTPT